MKRVLLITVIVLAGGGHAQAACPSEALAPKQVYRTTWRAVSPYFSAASFDAPRLVLLEQPGRMAEIAPSRSDRVRTVRIARTFWVELGGTSSCRRQLWARAGLIHEFAHVFQGDDVFLGQTPAIAAPSPEPWWWEPENDEAFYEGVPEGLAEAFAVYVMRHRYGIPLKAYDSSWDSYDAYSKEMTDLFSTRYILYGQFAMYRGQDPRSILYP